MAPYLPGAVFGACSFCTRSFATNLRQSRFDDMRKIRDLVSQPAAEIRTVKAGRHLLL
jgi:hypothetical protein